MGDPRASPDPRTVGFAANVYVPRAVHAFRPRQGGLGLGCSREARTERVEEHLSESLYARRSCPRFPDCLEDGVVPGDVLGRDGSGRQRAGHPGCESDKRRNSVPCHARGDRGWVNRRSRRRVRSTKRPQQKAVPTLRPTDFDLDPGHEAGRKAIEAEPGPSASYEPASGAGSLNSW